MVGDKEPKALPFFCRMRNRMMLVEGKVLIILRNLFSSSFLSRIDSLSTDILSVFTGGLQIPKGKVIAGICR